MNNLAVKQDIDDDYTSVYPPFWTKLSWHGDSLFYLGDDDSYIFELSSIPINKVYIPTTYSYNIWDNSTEILAKENICTVAISPGGLTEAINKFVLIDDLLAWGEDQSDEEPLEIRYEIEKIDYSKDELFKEVYRVYQECYEKKWDGYEAEPINENAFFEATKFIDLIPFDIPIPEVIPEPTGEIAFEWYRDNKHIFVSSLSGKGIISYAGLFGSYNTIHGTESFIDKIPDIIIDNIKRLE